MKKEIRLAFSEILLLETIHIGETLTDSESRVSEIKKKA
jgi:hypothetical protein